MHVSVYMPVCCMYVFIHVHVWLEANVKCLPPALPSLVFETGYLSEPQAHRFR